MAKNTNKSTLGAVTYAIAPGHTVTTLRGTLGAGAIISARDLAGGKETFDALIESKAVVVASRGKA